jgi:hypothetical protein
MLFLSDRVSAQPFPVEWQNTSRAGVGAKAPIVLPDGKLIAVRTLHFSKGAELTCFRSEDEGTSWSAISVIAADSDPVPDLGDAALLRMKSGKLLCSYRRNHCRRRSAAEADYALEVACSNDNGISWMPHSVVESSTGTAAGLWSTCLFETANGALQCYYDDEVTPLRHGFSRHQWLTMKTWDSAGDCWTSAVTVSRAHDPADLSRDGMCSVVETSPQKLLCIFESVQVDKPHHGLIRSVTSGDNGLHWSWESQERTIVYQPRNRRFSALAPWATFLPDDAGIACVFVTDEDRSKPDTPSTGILDEDVKCVYSFDLGHSWSKVPQIISSEHPCYLPGIAVLKRDSGGYGTIVQYSSAHGYRTKGGTIQQSAVPAPK